MSATHFYICIPACNPSCITMIQVWCQKSILLGEFVILVMIFTLIYLILTAMCYSLNMMFARVERRAWWITSHLQYYSPGRYFAEKTRYLSVGFIIFKKIITPIHTSLIYLFWPQRIMAYKREPIYCCKRYDSTIGMSLPKYWDNERA